MSVVEYIWDRMSKTSVPKGKGKPSFLKGPVPIGWIKAAANLPSGCLAVGMALWFMAGFGKSKTVRLSNNLLAEFGVGKAAKSRCLHHLENAGLVGVDRAPGRMPTVTILEGSVARHDGGCSVTH